MTTARKNFLQNLDEVADQLLRFITNRANRVALINQLLVYSNGFDTYKHRMKARLGGEYYRNIYNKLPKQIEKLKTLKDYEMDGQSIHLKWLKEWKLLLSPDWSNPSWLQSILVRFMMGQLPQYDQTRPLDYKHYEILYGSFQERIDRLLVSYRKIAFCEADKGYLAPARRTVNADLVATLDNALMLKYKPKEWNEKVQKESKVAVSTKVLPGKINLESDEIRSLQAVLTKNRAAPAKPGPGRLNLKDPKFRAVRESFEQQAGKEASPPLPPPPPRSDSLEHAVKNVSAPPPLPPKRVTQQPLLLFQRMTCCDAYLNMQALNAADRNDRAVLSH